MKNVLFGGLAATLLSTVAMAQAPAPADRAAKTHTRAEVAAKVERHFASADSNRDGAITQAEVEALHAQHSQRHGKRAQRQGRRDPAQFFERLDSNKDGQVTRAEFDAIGAARAQAKAPAPQHGQEMFARLDADRNGVISRAELDAGRELHQRRAAQLGGRMQKKGFGSEGIGGHMFAMADANKDGRVTLQEAQAAALRHFDMIDSNKDGRITPEEHRQMRGHMHHGAHKG